MFSVRVCIFDRNRLGSEGKAREHRKGARPRSIRNQPFFYFYNIAELIKVYSQDLTWRVINHQYLAGSSVQETADALYVSVGWVKKIRGMYKRRGHVWGNRRAGPRKSTSKYIYTVGLGVSTGPCLPMGILVYKVMIQNTSRPRCPV